MRRLAKKKTGMRRFAPAYRAGRLASERIKKINHASLTPNTLNTLWSEWFLSRTKKIRSWPMYYKEVNSYLQGVFQSQKSVPNWMLLPTNKSVSLVITAMNEVQTLALLVDQLQRLPLQELIVVLNGTTDGSFEAAHRRGATIVHYPQALGHDVGRAIGAKLTQSDITIFVDGDFALSAQSLIPFIYSIHCGNDVALNDISPYIGNIRNWDNVTLLKQFLNRCLNRQELGPNSLTAVPHALSRKAVQTIGTANLIVPPKAQSLAIIENLRISTPASINVISKNRQRRTNLGLHNPVSDLILGDHIEAIRTVMQTKGHRMGFDDHIRKREAATGGGI